MKSLLATVFGCLLASAAAAQEAERDRPASEAEEIALARSAAPPSVSADATILVLRNGRYAVAVDGTGGVTCLVARTWEHSLEPICFDPEAARTIMPLDIMRVELRLAGVATDEIERRIDAGFADGTLPVPRRPAIAYMMSAAQVLYADATTRVGRWQPHIHIFIPYATAEQFGGFSSAMEPAVGTVVDEGKATANLMIPVREFVEPAGR